LAGSPKLSGVFPDVAPKAKDVLRNEAEDFGDPYADPNPALKLNS
jgi:hypothetical protein